MILRLETGLKKDIKPWSEECDDRWDLWKLEEAEAKAMLSPSGVKGGLSSTGVKATLSSSGSLGRTPSLQQTPALP